VIDIELVRKYPEVLKEAAQKRGEKTKVDEVRKLDVTRRGIITKIDELRAHRNEVSRQLGNSKEKSTDLIQSMRDVGTQIKELENEEKDAAQKLQEFLLNIPNVPEETCPVGPDESANTVRETIVELPSFDFQPKAHWDIGENLGIVDLKGGVKLSQTRFYVLRGQGAKLQRALISWMLDVHIDKHGYEELYLPYLVNRETVTGSGHLPHFEENMYHDDEDDLFLVPTAEAPITGLLRNEIIAESDLPYKFVAHTPCWRREKFSAGRDTRGIKRVHQFDKVEMYKFVKPEDSRDELENLLSDAIEICIQLEIPHRIIELCTGDLGFSASKSYDLEMWGAGTSEWLEVSSCSNCTDFQSRRSAIRFRPASGGRPQLVHTLNGSGLAVPRVMIAILEHYQQEDGSVLVPEVLKPYTGFDILTTN
jgi:seryl-tRNA synthetase